MASSLAGGICARRWWRAGGSARGRRRAPLTPDWIAPAAAIYMDSAGRTVLVSGFGHGRKQANEREEIGTRLVLLLVVMDSETKPNPHNRLIICMHKFTRPPDLRQTAGLGLFFHKVWNLGTCIGRRMSPSRTADRSINI